MLALALLSSTVPESGNTHSGTGTVYWHTSGIPYTIHRTQPPITLRNHDVKSMRYGRNGIATHRIPYTVHCMVLRGQRYYWL
eukprot:6554718-Alexandrium_andersonii.AAC.1